MKKPGEIIWLTRKEGGEYECTDPADKEAYEKMIGFHSAGFADGKEWDVVNGWRGKKSNTRVHDRKAMEHVEGRR